MTIAPARPDQSAAGRVALIWKDGKVLPGFSGTDRSGVGHALAGDPETMAWVLSARGENSHFHGAAGYFELDEMAVEDVLADDEGTKLDWLDDTLVLVTSLIECASGQSEITITPVSILADPRALLVMADENDLALFRRALEKAQPSMLADGIAGALHAVLDAIVDTYTAALSRLTDLTDDLSEQLFADKPLVRADQLRAFQVRRSLARLRRIIDPMVDIAAGLSNAAARSPNRQSTDPAEKLLGTRSAREFADVGDHVAHASAAAKSLREEIASMYETNLALSDVHLNTVMKKLAGWAAIIAVPTLITGFMGMNVPYPGFSQTSGFVVALIVMIVAVSVLFMIFRRKDWL